MKKKGILGNIKEYYQTHMWCSFAFAIFTAVVLIVFILMGYLKNAYYDYLVESTYDTEKALLSSVNKNIENQMSTMIDIGSMLAVDDSITAEIEHYKEESDNVNANDAYNNKLMKNILQSASRSSSSITGIAIVSENGILYQFDRNEMGYAKTKGIWSDENEENITSIFSEMKQSNADNQLPRYMIVTHPLEHPNIKNRGLIHIAFPLKNGYDYKDMKYMLVVSYYNQQISALLKQLKQGQKDGTIQGYIEGENEEILLHTEQQYTGTNAGIFREEKGYTDLETPIGDYGWSLHGVINERALKEKVDEMYQKAILLYIAAIVVILLILFWVTRKILHPADIISRSIKRVKSGDMQEQIAIEGKNEIWQLAQEYNEMLHSIRLANQEVEEQHGQVIETMKMKQQAEREALESQINAHFICNTLNAINYEAIDSGNYKVSVLLKKLSNILRYTFDQKHQNVYMFQEITWIEQYLFLQKERMETVFVYEILFDSDYDNWPCRKLMLQPFVENSILHGFEGKAGGGKIRIVGEGYKEFLKIVIEDNGCGMDENRKQTILEIIQNPIIAKKKEVGIGISNVIARMRMYYGEQIQILLESEKGKGTRFTFILPVPK